MFEINNIFEKAVNSTSIVSNLNSTENALDLKLFNKVILPKIVDTKSVNKILKETRSVSLMIAELLNANQTVCRGELSCYSLKETNNNSSQVTIESVPILPISLFTIDE